MPRILLKIRWILKAIKLAKFQSFNIVNSEEVHVTIIKIAEELQLPVIIPVGIKQ
jgi:hypothetical protein